MLSESDILELSGEASFDDVRDLNLRNQKLSSFESYAPLLPSILALSLSHNQLSTLRGFHHLHLLTSLNVNFNQLNSLEGIQSCKSLEKLFAANNMIRDLSPLACLPMLTTVSLYKNAIASLDAAVHTLCTLSCLSDLDLGGSPCSLVPEYKHRLVLELPSLATLDGDSLTDLDREMAADVLGWTPAEETAPDDDEEELRIPSASGEGIAGLAEQGVLDDPAGGNGSTSWSGGGGGTVVGPRGLSGGCGEAPNVLVVVHQDEDNDGGPSVGGARIATSPHGGIIRGSRPMNDSDSSSDRTVDTRPLSGSSTAAAAGPMSGSSYYKGGAPATPMALGGARGPSGRIHGGRAAGGNPLPSRPGTAALSRPGTAYCRPGTSGGASRVPRRPGTSAGSVRLSSNEFLNDHPVLLEYLAKHVLQEGLALVQQQQNDGSTGNVEAGGGGSGGSGSGAAAVSSLVGRLRGSFVSRLRGTTAVNTATEGMAVGEIVASGRAVIADGGGDGGGAGGVDRASSPSDARAAALESLVMDASPHETIRQLVRLCEVLIKEVEASRQQSSSTSASGTKRLSGPGGGSSRPPSGGPPPPAAAAGIVVQAGNDAAAAPRSRPLSTGRRHQLLGSTAAALPEAAAAAVAVVPAVGTPPGGLPADNGVHCSTSRPDSGSGGSSSSHRDSAARNGSGGDADVLRVEVARLTREVTQLRVENQNMYWLVDEHKAMRAEIKRLKEERGS